MSGLFSLKIGYMFWVLHSFNFKISNHTIMSSNITRYFSKPEPNMLKNLTDYSFQHFPKNFSHYSYFILTSLPIIPILFLCINVSDTYCHSEKQNLESCHRYIDNIAWTYFSHTSKMVNESHPCLF